ncbi:MAG: M56 family metallopeptidase [Bacteroidales bacterium]|nr:M56 family metallopeptidase [Bacteroidales bacterium]MBN2819033.1 M56 family metallopeptidase [Bacteroidales bacterium]
MNSICNLFSEEIIEAIGWTLFHSLWQGALIAILLISILFVFQKTSANTRYALAFAALFSALLWASGTFYSSYKYAKEKQQIKQAILQSPKQITRIFNETLSNQSLQTDGKSKTGIKKIEFRAFMQRNFPLVFILWLAGVFVFFLRMSGGMLQIHKLRKTQTMSVDSFWLQKVNNYCNKIGINKKIEALQSSLAKAPMVIGHIKPVILFPVSIFTGLSVNEIEAVIAHELAHIKRHDYLLNIIQSMIEIIFFFHPGIWLISRIIRDEREHSCDDLAVRLTGDKLTYMKALASSEELILKNKYYYSVAFPGKEGSLLHRIKRINNINTMKKNVTEGFLAASIIFISLILLSFTFDSQNLKRYAPETQEFPDPSNKTTVSVSTSSKKEVKPNHRIIQRVIHEKDDSVKVKVIKISESSDSLSEEMEKIIEIALSDNSDDIAQIVIRSLDSVWTSLNVSAIVNEAMRQTDSALKQINIDLIVQESMEAAKEDMKKAKVEMQKAKKEMEAHKDIMKQVTVTLDSINIDSIVNSAMKNIEINIDGDELNRIINLSISATQDALKDIDIEAIIEEAMNFENDFQYEYNYDSTKVHKKVIRKEIMDEETGKKSIELEEKLIELEGEE